MDWFNLFKKRALNPCLSDREKIGFSDTQRLCDEKILPDIFTKIFNITMPVTNGGGGYKIMDIGCGCSKPVLDLIDFAEQTNSSLFLVDSQEMLDNLPNKHFIVRLPYEFPNDKLLQYEGTMDIVICYSVLMYIQDYLPFIDFAVKMLAPKGRLLLGDIPNLEKRRRFLRSQEGQNFHKRWSNSNEIPQITQKQINQGINDGLIISILKRYRMLGYETYLLEQSSDLPFCHTREDIIISRTWN